MITALTTHVEKYKLNYQIGNHDQVHLSTVVVDSEVPVQCTFGFPLENGETALIELTFKDQGIGIRVSGEIFPGNIWCFMFSNTVIEIPPDSTVTVNASAVRFQLIQVPLDVTGISIKIEKT